MLSMSHSFWVNWSCKRFLSQKNAFGYKAYNYICNYNYRKFMERTATLLLNILRNELWGNGTQPGKISSKDYHAIMNMAMKQTVAGMVAHAVSSNKTNVELTPSDAAKTLMVEQQIKKQNEQINTELGALADLFETNGISYLVFKGQTIAARYPTPWARTSGDIDFYVPQKDFDKALGLLKTQWKIDADQGQSYHHIEFEHNDVVFEMHYEILKFFSPTRQKIFDEMVDRSQTEYVEIDGRKIPTLDQITNIIYTFGHLWYHLLEIGVGMRQLCDLAVLISDAFCPDDEDYTHKALRLKKQLEQLGYCKAFCAIENVLAEHFGLKHSPIPNTLSRRYSASLLERTIRYGNFGKYGRKGSRAEFKFYISLTFERIFTFLKFYPLDRKEIRARIFKEIPEKILLFGKR